MVQAAVKRHRCPHFKPNLDSALSSIEMKNSHDKLLLPSHTKVYSHQIWVVMLAGIRLFLRRDEVVKLKYEDMFGELALFNIKTSF